MRHLLSRPQLQGATEQVIIVDGEEPYLDGSKDLMDRLAARGVNVTHRLFREIPEQFSLRGVPLLIFASPHGEVAYLGGYGMHEDQDVFVFQQIRAGQGTDRLPVVGCAVGTRLRRRADPFRLKY